MERPGCGASSGGGQQARGVKAAVGRSHVDAGSWHVSTVHQIRPDQWGGGKSWYTGVCLQLVPFFPEPGDGLCPGLMAGRTGGTVMAVQNGPRSAGGEGCRLSLPSRNNFLDSPNPS